MTLNQDVTAYECKGHLTDVEVSTNEVEKWLKSTIVGIRNYFLEQDQYKSLMHRFEFWTTGQLSSDAKALLETAKANTKKYSIE